MRDADHILRDGTSNLTADETIAFTLTGGQPKEAPLAVHVLVPTLSASDTLTVTIRGVTTSQKITVSHTDALTQGTTTVPYTLKLPIPPSESTAWELFLDVGGSSVNHGAVQAWIERLEDYAKVDADL
ncbi:hypothetical protein LCGC14_0980500 [marine sediment metagenome]|uniref:Uncharacterized protein n=1 Tax=marine sediment metagenome TaxID=412755 RepID=A0A0F9QS61_9ZZZZ